MTLSIPSITSNSKLISKVRILFLEIFSRLLNKGIEGIEKFEEKSFLLNCGLGKTK